MRVAHRKVARSIRRNGVTLIEMIIVVLILGIVAAVAVPKFGDTLDQTRAQAAINRIQADLRLARQTARSKSTPVTVSFDMLQHSYSMPVLVDLDHSGAAYSVVLNASPYNTILAGVNLGGDTAIIFDHFGNPDSAGTIVVQAGSFQRTLTIDPNALEAISL